MDDLLMICIIRPVYVPECPQGRDAIPIHVAGQSFVSRTVALLQRYLIVLALRAKDDFNSVFNSRATEDKTQLVQKAGTFPVRGICYLNWNFYFRSPT